MTYHVEKAIDKIGKELVLFQIFHEGITQIELHQFIGLSNSNKRLGVEIYKRIYNYLNISGMPYSSLSKEDRKFKLATDRSMPNYWDDSFLVYELFRRIESPIINIAEDRFRAVIHFGAHPKANKDSRQIKAHIIAWELYNKQYVPDNFWVVPIDGDYLNMEEDNLILVNTTEYKSNRFKGVGNPAYMHGRYTIPRLGGWSIISKNNIKRDGCCKICGNTDMLVVHHIISYHLFSKPMEANQDSNLITLCRHCHGKIHGHTLSIKKVLISEMRYSKLIELLETLKSQVPDTLMETYKDVEKQLGLTDNQHPSTV